MCMRRFIPKLRHAVKYLLVGAMVSVCLVITLYRSSTWYNYIEYIDQLRKVNYRMKNVSSNLPYIYVITPTYTRLVQKAELTRLSQTLRLVPKLHWILVEDTKEKTKLVTNCLMQSHLSYTHLAITEAKKDTTKRGVLQRNAGLTWLRTNNKTNGVVYFADDDNTYDVRLFEEEMMRSTKKVAVWPVGLITQLRAEGCIVNNGKVTGWFASYAPKRKYAIDMAGFAVNLRLIHDKADVWFGGVTGYLETELLSKIGVEVHDLEPKADNCSKVLVWHTKTEKANLRSENSTLKQFGFSASLFEEV